MAESVEKAAGLELLDVIQLKGLNRFSGCISVEDDGFDGRIFFRDGQIVHAEAGGATGEEAFHAIVQRPDVAFTLERNVATTSHTIQRSWQLLIMESQRLLDEARRSGTALKVASPEEKRASLLERVRRIPGVDWAALPSRGGASPDGGAAETPDDRAAQLEALAAVVGEQLRVGEATGATVQGAERHLLFMAGKAHHLLVLFLGGQRATAIEAELRKVLAARK